MSAQTKDAANLPFTRKQKQARRSNGPMDVPNEGIFVDEDDAPPARKPKRARAMKTKSVASRKKNVRGAQGGVSWLLKVPLEIFIEIATRVTPSGLISLSLTNKLFRGILLKPSSFFIWERVRANVPNLPPCPSGIPEPRFAALISFKYCTFCGTSAPANPNTPLWGRLCAECRDTKQVVPPREYIVVD